MKRVNFEHGSILKNILMTALPMLVAQLINLLYNIVDRIYIGRIPETGTIALGAVGLCFPIIILIGGFTNLYGMGGAPLFSMECGRKDIAKATAILNSSFRLLIVTGCILTLVGEIAAPAILTAFGAASTDMGISLPYIRIYLIGTVFLMLSTGMNAFINAQGYALIGMISVIIGAVSNIVLDPIFIFALGLGVNGAAIATIIAQVLSALFVLKFLLGRKNDFRLCRGRILTETGKGLAAVPKLFPYIKDIVGLGLSPFVMQCTNALVSIVCNSILISIGGSEFVAVMTLISSVRQIVDTPALSFTEGASPTISYNYGARRPAKVRRAIFVMAAFAIGYTFFMWLFIENQPYVLLGIFTEDTVLQNMALRPLHLYFFAFIFQALQYSGQTVYKALNKKKRAIFFSIFRKVILVVPLAYMLPYIWGMGTDGVFMAEPISNLIGGLASFVTMLLTILPELKKMEK